jgi:hypothetical protein
MNAKDGGRIQRKNPEEESRGRIQRKNPEEESRGRIQRNNLEEESRGRIQRKNSTRVNTTLKVSSKPEVNIDT